MLLFTILFRSWWPGRGLGAGLGGLLLLLATGLAQGQAAPFMVRATPAGGVGLNVGRSQLLTATAVYPAFLSAGFTGNVLATAVQPDGKIVVGGSFSQYGTTTRQYLARLNADGTLDASFTTGLELNGAVAAIALQPDGGIIIGGDFTTFGTVPCLRLARLLPTGALDPTLNTSSTGVGFSGGGVRALAVQPNGGLVVGGEFGASGANANSAFLVRLLSTGVFDASFAAATHGVSPSTFTINDAVLALLAQANNDVVVGGRFLAGRHRVARLSSSGVLDATFASTPNSGPATGEVAALAQVGTGFAVGGSFSGYTSGGTSYPNYQRLALLGSDGELDLGFTPLFGAATSGQVTSLAALSATRLLVGGQFTAYDNQPANNIVRVTTTGSRDPDFAGGTGFSAGVNSLATQPNGYVVVGGQFTTYQKAGANHITRLKPDGSAQALDVPVPGPVAYTWNTGPTGPTLQANQTGFYWATATIGTASSTSNTVALTVAPPTLVPITVSVTPPGPLSGAPGQVLTAKAEYPALKVGTGFYFPPDPNDPNVKPHIFSFATQPNGKLVVGGRFSSYNGTPCQFIARLNADGSYDPAFAHTTTGGLDALVLVLAIQPDGKIVVTGDFNYYGTKKVRNVARLNTDGTLDTNFATNNSVGFPTSNNAIVAQPDGRLLVACNSENYITGVGAQVSVGYVARLLPDGTRDTSFNPESTGGLDSYPYALALQPDGKVLVAGHFGSYGPTARERVARLNADGSLDPTFNPNGTGLTTPGNTRASDVYTLALQPDGKVLVGGTFAARLIRLNADGSRDLTFTSPTLSASGTGAPPEVSSLALLSNGRILVGGEFAGNIMRLQADGTPDPSFSITGTGFDDRVQTLALQADGQVLVGGAFANYASTTGNRRALARLRDNGALDDANTPLNGTATYAWSDGSTGPTLAVAASGTYTATATFLGQTALSNAVAVTVNGTPPAPTIPVTPTGPLSLCAGGSQTLTAQVPSLPAGATSTYAWWQVASGGGAPIYRGPGTLTTIGSVTTNAYLVNANTPGDVPGQYYFTTTWNNGTSTSLVASATVSVGLAPQPVLTTPVAGLPGTNVVLKGTDLAQVTEVRFATSPTTYSSAVFAASASVPTELTATVPPDAIPGAISVLTACSATPISFAGLFSFLPPTLSTAAPLAGAQGSSVLVTGSNFVMGAGATTATLNGVAVTVTVVSGTQLLVAVPTTATPVAGPLVVTTLGGSASAPFTVTASGSPLVTTTIDAPGITTLPPGSSYGNLVIKSPAVVVVAGNATGGGGLTVSRLEVQKGATLRIENNAVVAGPAGGGGSFLLAAEATLAVGHPNGVGSAAAPGAIQLASLFFSPDASYEYTGSQPQATGSNLPSQVRSLTSTNSSRLTLSQPVRIARVLTMAGAGHFFLNTQRLTLLSNASGTALAINKAGAGRVLGTATVQRYINPVANAGTGFRYYGSPVKGATAAVLAAPAFDYDQSRYRPTARQDTLPLISYGFTTSALVPNTPLEVGHGYRAAVPAATTVQFTGTLTTGDTTLTLTRKTNEAYNGWNLVSNPYPAPLNWTKLVAKGAAVGLEAAIYVYESTGTNTGSYRSYVNGVSNDNLTNQTDDTLLIAMGQAFFVRVSEGRTTGTLTFRTDCRETSYARQASFSRTALARPFEISADFSRNGSGGGSTGCNRCGHSSHITVYLDADGASGARQAFNPKLDADARSLFSFSQQTLSIRGSSASGDSTLSIRAIAPPTGPQTVPLVLSATTPGSYSIQVGVEELSQLTPGLVPYLHDLNPATPANEWHNLSSYAAPASPLLYTFDLSATEVLSTVINRFEIVFRSVITATTPASTGLGSVEVFPNPAQHRIHVVVPAVPGATQVQATLFNAMGQVVLRQNTPLPAAGTALNIGAEKLAGGVYILRLQAGGSIATRRVVLEN